MKKNILIIGIGKRTRNDILPALQASGKFNVIGIYARTAREVQVGEAFYSVKKLDSLTANELAQADWIYMGVLVQDLMNVLKFLSSFATKNVRLLMDTPVLPRRYAKAKKYFDNFLETVVAEDVIYLPWIDPLRNVLGGKITRLVFDQSAYAFHGIALAKTLVDSRKFKKARIEAVNGKKTVQLVSPAGVHVSVIEPRDYSKGHMIFSGPAGTVSDSLPYNDSSMRPIISKGLCIGLNIGGIAKNFSEAESKLVGPVPENATITSLTLQLKRIGMMTMLNSLAENENGGWSVEDAFQDIRLHEYVHYFGKYINVAPLVK